MSLIQNSHQTIRSMLSKETQYQPAKTFPRQLYIITPLLLSLTPSLHHRTRLSIALQLVIRQIMPRVHLILNRVLEAELPALDLFSRRAELGFREAHALQESHS